MMKKGYRKGYKDGGMVTGFKPCSACKTKAACKKAKKCLKKAKK
jgi:hypothetical protein